MSYHVLVLAGGTIWLIFCPTFLVSSNQQLLMEKQAEPFPSNKVLPVSSGKQILLTKEEKQKTLSNIRTILFHFCILPIKWYQLFPVLLILQFLLLFLCQGEWRRNTWSNYFKKPGEKICGSFEETDLKMIGIMGSDVIDEIQN